MNGERSHWKCLKPLTSLVPGRGIKTTASETHVDRLLSNQRLSLSYCFDLQPYMKVSPMISPIVKQKLFHDVHRLVYSRFLVEQKDIEKNE